jgi:hypothetical protein
MPFPKAQPGGHVRQLRDVWTLLSTATMWQVFLTVLQEEEEREGCSIIECSECGKGTCRSCRSCAVPPKGSQACCSHCGKPLIAKKRFKKPQTETCTECGIEVYIDPSMKGSSGQTLCDSCGQQQRLKEDQRCMTCGQRRGAAFKECKGCGKSECDPCFEMKRAYTNMYECLQCGEGMCKYCDKKSLLCRCW